MHTIENKIAQIRKFDLCELSDGCCENLFMSKKFEGNKCMLHHLMYQDMATIIDL